MPVHLATASTSHAQTELGCALEPLQRARSVPHWDAHTDVLIVGAGAAGASAAIEARALGAEVLLLERASDGGGSTALSGGILYFGGGSELQTACGFQDDIEEMFKYLLAASGPNPDELKVRMYCERNLEHFAWVKAQGLSFSCASFFGR